MESNDRRSGPMPAKVRAVLAGATLAAATFSALFQGLYNNLYLSLVMALMAGFSLGVFMWPQKSAACDETIVQTQGAGARISGLIWCAIVLAGLFLFTTNFSEGFSSDAMLTAGLCGTIFVMSGRAEIILQKLFSRVPPPR